MKGLLYKGKKIADKGYILNLPERTDRLESTKKLLDELGFEGYEVFSGTKIEDLEYRKLGCTASYISLFGTVLTSSIQDIVVFEDDIKLMDSTSKDDLDKIFEDWDEIKNTYDVVALGTKLLPRTKIKVNGDTHGSYEEMLCTQSFYYKRPIIEHTYEQLKAFMDSSNYLHKCTIDMFLNDCSCEQFRFIHSDKHKKFEFGITIPMVFSQSSSYSDNENREQDYDQIMEQSYYNALKFPKAYVLYSTENYFDIVTESVKSIREFSSLPVIVYMLNSDKIIQVPNTRTIRWECPIENLSDKCYTKSEDNFYIDRRNSDIYRILIQRPLIIKDALTKHAETVSKSWWTMVRHFGI